jgi:hypothetical protein
MKRVINIGIFLASISAMLGANNLPFDIVKTPAAKNSSAPNLCSLGEHFALSWVESQSDGAAQMQIARWNGEGFDKHNLVAESKQMFSNWADIPSVIEAPTGDLYAHWLDRLSGKPYAYGVRLEFSTNRGKNWKSMGWLHDDTSATEHGFVSLIADGKHVRAFWLDGRAMTEPTGKMMLRTAILEGDQIKDEQMLDDNVCTCCPTSSVQLEAGPVVVYRDRSPREIRDISYVLRTDDRWSEPANIKTDNWLMPGCPVNGASIARSGDLVAISRFTVIHNKAHVILRFFKHGEIKSGKDIVLDNNAPVGRCATVCTKDSIYTVWMGLEKKQTVLRMAEVSLQGEIVRQTTLSTIDGNRSSGIPRAILNGGYLWVTWTDSNRIRLGRLKTLH